MSNTAMLPQVNAVSASDMPVRALIYGDTGAGKTSLAITAKLHEQMQPVLVLDFDDGLSSVAHVPDVYRVKVVSSDMMMAVVGELIKPRNQRSGVYKEARTLIIDSISAMRDDVLIEAVERNARKDALSGKPRALMMPQFQDYGQTTYLITSFMNALSQTDYHIILTAGQDKERSADGLTVTGIKPLINPKLRQVVGHMMSFIWYVRQKESDYRLLTLSKGLYQIKTRNPLFERAIRSETRRRIADKWAGDSKLSERLDAGEGWWFLDMDDDGYVTPNIAYLYDLYLQAISKS